jgi:hypothetical protein
MYVPRCRIDSQEIAWMVIVDSFAQQLLFGVISPLLRSYFPPDVAASSGRNFNHKLTRPSEAAEDEQEPSYKMKMKLRAARAANETDLFDT